MLTLALSTVCPSFLRPCKHSATLNTIRVSLLVPSRNTYLCHPTTHLSRRCRTGRLRTCTCQSKKALRADSSVPLGTNTGRVSGHRHALFNDFNLTEPFGILNAAAGIFGLFFKGGWFSTLTIICGFALFTLGSMSHHNAVEGADSSWTHTLVSAAVCGVLAQRYYQKAIVGVTGTMVMTIMSALICLACVYNVVAGGNKPQPGTSSRSSATAARSPSQTSSVDASGKAITATQPEAQHTMPEWESNSMQQASALQRGGFQSPWGANAHTLVSVTGAVLYAQGLWGLWGEIVGYSPAGLAAAAASGLVVLGVARALVQQSDAGQADVQ